MKYDYPSRDRQGADTNRDKEWPEGVPFAYYITFTCYGTKLYGDETGTVDRAHNIPGTPALPINPKRVNEIRKRLKHPPYEMDIIRRDCVLSAIKEVCGYREWRLLAAHIRVLHVHTVVQAPVKPEKILNDFKAYASRALNRMNIDPNVCKRWSRHGSTRYLWNSEDADAIIHYVVYEQGEPMAVYEGE